MKADRMHYMFREAADTLSAGRPVHLVTLKTRSSIQRDIPRELQGWWADVCPGETLVLTDATDADLQRCILNEKQSRDPADYFVEVFERGALVSRAAAARVTTITAGAQA